VGSATGVGRPQGIANLQQPLVRGLACAALQPGLRSVLLFDSSPPMLRMAAGLLAEMLTVTTERSVEQVYLGPTDTEETLWGSLALTPQGEEQPFVWQPGLLGSGDDSVLRVVVIPDLTRLSLAASRACIALMDSDVANLERHGHQARWRSHLCWIAGCPRSQVKFLSPHLMDRFALRLTGQAFQERDHVAALREWFATLDEPQALEPMLTTELRDRLQQANRQESLLTNTAFQRGLAYFTEPDGQGCRRELALIRLAQAQAQLAGLAEVGAKQVDQAARFIGLQLSLPLPPNEPIEPTEPEQPFPSEPGKTEPLPQSGIRDTANQIESSSEKKRVYSSDSKTEFPSAPVDFGQGSPYPEDYTPTEREAASLRLPPRRFRNAAVGQGTIVGVEPATVPQDIAWVSTLLEAAKYQAVRPQENGFGLTLQASDLRRYRRAVVPEQMLMVVLDYTCLKECKWQEALLPYLQWAYVEWASVCLVQVGAETTAERELQANKITAQSVLVPRIRTALESGAGRATPLAHGLNLTLQALRHSLQHGRSTAQKAVVVIISDGRGNVPLKSSQSGESPSQSVMRQGIEDALAVAEQIRQLKHVEPVVLNPQPKYYADLPIKLAQALGVNTVDISPLYVGGE
jgi:magnesium chelatase subunit D